MISEKRKKRESLQLSAIPFPSRSTSFTRLISAFGVSSSKPARRASPCVDARHLALCGKHRRTNFLSQRNAENAHQDPILAAHLNSR